MLCPSCQQRITGHRRKLVSCSQCQHEACSDCLKRHLVKSSQCSTCTKEWPQDVLVEALGANFVKKKLPSLRLDELIEYERSLPTDIEPQRPVQRPSNSVYAECTTGDAHGEFQALIVVDIKMTFLNMKHLFHNFYSHPYLSYSFDLHPEVIRTQRLMEALVEFYTLMGDLSNEFVFRVEYTPSFFDPRTRFQYLRQRFRQSQITEGVWKRLVKRRWKRTQRQLQEREMFEALTWLAHKIYYEMYHSHLHPLHEEMKNYACRHDYSRRDGYLDRLYQILGSTYTKVVELVQWFNQRRFGNFRIALPCPEHLEWQLGIVTFDVLPTFFEFHVDGREENSSSQSFEEARERYQENLRDDNTGAAE